MKKKNKHLGSSLDDFLTEEGLLEETTEKAIKEVLAWQLKQTMAEKNLSISEMARQMKTSRPTIDRLLDPGNCSVKLHTLQKAAAIVGRHIRLELV